MLLDKLQQHFAHSEFRPGQQEVIDRLLAGSNSLALFPTGGGKSLCYQLPSLLLPGLTIVISPLLALMKDQVDKAVTNGQRAIRYDSTLSIEGKECCLAALEANEIDLLYISPESFAAAEIHSLLKGLAIDLIAIDEIHCYSEWGHSFRPAYLHLPRLVRTLKPNAVLGLTATATKKVASEIRKAFRIKLTDQVSTSFHRPNLNYTVIPTQAENRLDVLSSLLLEGLQGPTIVYAMRQVDTMEIAAHLQAKGLIARSYHAGMDTAAREHVQLEFLNDNIRIIVATIAFGMGIDKPNVRQVIHFHLPKSPEGWMQESGRAGRDGKPADCTLLACGDDIRQLRSFIHSRTVEASALASILRSIHSADKIWLCAPFMLAVQHDLSAGVIGIILLHLEQLKLIKHTTTSWRYLRIRKLRFGSAITGLSKRHAMIAEQLTKLEQRFDTLESEERFQISRSKLINIADELEKSGEFSIRRSGWTEEYKVLNDQFDLDEVTNNINKILQTRLDEDFQRLEDIISLVSTRSCITKKLLLGFGERISEPCGNCSSCRKETRPRKLPRSSVPELGNNEIEIIQSVHQETHSALKGARTLTRFLCDLPSPKLRYYRLYQHNSHGALANFDHEEVELQARLTLGQLD